MSKKFYYVVDYIDENGEFRSTPWEINDNENVMNMVEAFSQDGREILFISAHRTRKAAEETWILRTAAYEKNKEERL